MMRAILAILLLTAPLARGASHYFDNAASGANNGTSWANAWQNSASINLGSIADGDTFYISGGSTNKAYHEDINLAVNGTAVARVTVRVGQDAGHNGMVNFGTNKVLLGSAPYGITFDGHRGLDYASPTNWAQVEERDWTNNIGFWFNGRVGLTTAYNDPNLFYWGEGMGELTMRYVMVTGYTNVVSGTCCGAETGLDERGILFEATIENQSVTNVIFEHMYLAHNSGNSFAFSSATNTAFDGVIARYNLIEYYGEDMFKVHSGWTIRDNVLGPSEMADVHADMFQLTGSYIKVNNNYIKEGNHSYMRMQSTASTSSNAPTINHSIYIFNNVHSEIPGRSSHGGVWNEGWNFLHWDSQAINGGHLMWSNVIVANNTHYGSISNTVKAQMRAGRTISWTTGTYITNAWVTNIYYLNNIWVQQHKGVSFPWTKTQGGLHNDFAVEDFVIDYNLLAGTNGNAIEDSRKFSFYGEDALLEAHTYKLNNRTNWPSFVDATTGDFELSAGDTAAKDMGTNLSDIFNYDSLNRPRNVGGAWDIGALEAQETNLVVLLTFDNDTFGNATDSSGLGNTGKRFTLVEDNYPSNKVYNASGAPGTTFRPNFTGNWSDCLWTNNQGTYGFYGYNGGYFALTNVTSRLTNNAQLTVMVWARYNSAKRVDASFDSSQAQNDTLLSGGGLAGGTKGSWHLGRYNQLVNRGETRFVVQTNDGFSGGVSWGSEGDPVFGYGSGNQVIFQFSDIGDVNNGDTTNWYHYAVVFSNSVVRLYFNTTNCATGTIPTVSALTLGDGALRAYDWVGVGVNTHVGTPEYDDETGNDYPNNGFHNGGLDQVRIYDRALSRAEIVEIANAEGGAFEADEPADPPTPIAPAVRIGTLNVGTMVFQ